MAVPPHHFDDDPGDAAPGGLLGELERRQDDVLAQLDDLDAKLAQVLKGLEPSDGDAATASSAFGGELSLGDSESSPGDVTRDSKVSDGGPDDLEDDDSDSAEDWA